MLGRIISWERGNLLELRDVTLSRGWFVDGFQIATM